MIGIIHRLVKELKNPPRLVVYRIDSYFKMIIKSYTLIFLFWIIPRYGGYL